MKNITDEMIREKAYYLWIEAGSPECDGKEFWEKACEEIYAPILKKTVKKEAQKKSKVNKK